MRVLYGVQGTGNGHITRARALTPALRACGVDVDILISGRARAELFGADVLGEYQWREGMSFVMEKGRINPLKTVLNVKPITLLQDIRALDLSDYDVVISDFEPVTAWAAKKQAKRCIGIGHQYAFRSAIPTHGINIPSRLVMRWFAPVSQWIGLHWYPFTADLFPPLLEPMSASVRVVPGKFLVYLPFESVDDMLKLLAPFKHCEFHLYAGVSTAYQSGCVQVKPFSREQFRQDLLECEGVITGAGFELPSEAIVLGKKLLVRPLLAQLEQESNAKALKMMGRALVMRQLCPNAVVELLAQAMPEPVSYPNMATVIARWVANGAYEPLPDFAQRCWQQTKGMGGLGGEKFAYGTAS